MSALRTPKTTTMVLPPPPEAPSTQPPTTITLTTTTPLPDLQPFVPLDRIKIGNAPDFVPPDRLVPGDRFRLTIPPAIPNIPIKSTPKLPTTTTEKLTKPIVPTSQPITEPPRTAAFVPPDRQLTPTPPTTTHRVEPFIPPDRIKITSSPPTPSTTTLVVSSSTNKSSNPVLGAYVRPGSTPPSNDATNLTRVNLPNFITTEFDNSTNVTEATTYFNNLNPFQTFNTDQNRLTLANSRVCGFLPFCEDKAYESCYNTTVNTCDQCSQSGAGLFLFFVILLGLCIVIGNAIVLCVGGLRQRKGKLNKMDVCRSSLAGADILAGIQILVVTLSNFAWSYNSTAIEIDRRQLELRGSLEAFFGSFLYMLCYTSSIYHLFYMGLMRVYAITKPIRFKWQSLNAVYVGLGIVWAISIIAATTPAWSPTTLTYSYFVPVYLFLPSIKQITLNQSYTPAIVLLIVFLVIPFILMTLITVTCSIILAISFKRKSQRFNSSSNNSIYKQKIKAFVTIAIMQMGFTVTLIPVAVVVVLIYAEKLDCSNYSIPYAICFYLSMSNSLVNVIIYNIRDKTFRSSVKELFSMWFTKPFYSTKTSTTKSNSHSKDKSASSDSHHSLQSPAKKTTNFMSEDT